MVNPSAEMLFERRCLRSFQERSEVDLGMMDSGPEGTEVQNVSGDDPLIRNVRDGRQSRRGIV